MFQGFFMTATAYMLASLRRAIMYDTFLCQQL